MGSVFTKDTAESSLLLAPCEDKKAVAVAAGKLNRKLHIVLWQNGA